MAPILKHVHVFVASRRHSLMQMPNDRPADLDRQDHEVWLDLHILYL